MKKIKQKLKKTKHFKIFTIISVIIGLFIIIISGILFFIKRSFGLGSMQVADYEKRIPIWNVVAGNSNRSKLEDMAIDYENNNILLSMLAFADAIVGTNYKDAEQTIDTFTYLYEIKSGYEKETYEDEPYLIPYLVENSESAIIVIPGGGYGYKSIDGSTGEGKDIALALNKAGINAFVLHYRSNPYTYPIPQLDVQRAVRYLRANAKTFGFNENQIGLLGYSAGGYQIGSYINLIMGRNLFPSEYQPDEIDYVDDTVISVGMIYPALTYQYNVPMLFSSFDADKVRDLNEREKLLKQTHLPLHFSSEAIPQFIAYGTKDTMVNQEGIKEYIAVAKEAGGNVMEVIAEEQNHGFDQRYYMNTFIDWFNKTIVSK